MLHMHLLARIRIHRLSLLSIDIEAHIPGYQAPLAPTIGTSLGVDNAVAALGGLDELGVLLFEDGEVALGFPVPDGVGGEDEVHFFEGALVCFGVEGPDYDDGGGVDGAEEVEGFFVEALEDCGEEEHLLYIYVSV